mmetsp:Transcript_13361/g.32425  ORF Transcript_13361/g.32425 Transcript_13361/m.32425 type:complete len:418 (-) Transcript_13361:196-1449(-)
MESPALRSRSLSAGRKRIASDNMNARSFTNGNLVVKNTLQPSESISAVDINALPGDDAHTEMKPLVDPSDNDSRPSSSSTGITATGIKVLILLAVQNSAKNILLRFVMKEHPKFLTATAILGIEGVKLVLSLLYILIIERRPIMSVVTFVRQDKRNTLLMCVPATLYSIQMTLEYVALGNIDAAVFSVLVQTKMLATAACAVFIMGKRIKKVQLISLVLLTIGVMLCNMKNPGKTPEIQDDAAMGDPKKGILATLGISACSGMAAVYTEKVIKAKRSINIELPSQQEQMKIEPLKENYGLAYTQVQLAFVSLIIMGFYCIIVELDEIWEKGLWYGFNGPAFISIFVSSIGGLIVAAVLKYADAVLKGYATAISVVLTGVMSMFLFGTHLNALYFLGIGNVVCAVFLYSATDLDRLLC